MSSSSLSPSSNPLIKIVSPESRAQTPEEAARIDSLQAKFMAIDEGLYREYPREWNRSGGTCQHQNIQLEEYVKWREILNEPGNLSDLIKFENFKTIASMLRSLELNINPSTQYNHAEQWAYWGSFFLNVEDLVLKFWNRTQTEFGKDVGEAFQNIRSATLKRVRAPEEDPLADVPGIPTENLNEFLRFSPQLSRLDIELIKMHEDNFLENIVEKCKYLTALNISGKTIKSLDPLNRLDFLCELTMDNVQFPNGGVEFRKIQNILSKLEELSLAHNDSITDTILHAFAWTSTPDGQRDRARFGNLKGLNINNCTEVTDHGMDAIFPTFPNLERLHMAHTSIEGGILKSMAFAAQTLVHFDVSGTQLKNAHIDRLNKLQNLRSLTMQSMDEITKEGWKKLKPPNLTMLDISYNDNLRNYMLETILEKNPSLKKLSILGCDNIKSEQLTSSFQYMRHMEELEMDVKLMSSDIAQGILKLPHILSLGQDFNVHIDKDEIKYGGRTVLSTEEWTKIKQHLKQNQATEHPGRAFL